MAGEAASGNGHVQTILPSLFRAKPDCSGLPAVDLLHNGAFGVRTARTWLRKVVYKVKRNATEGSQKTQKWRLILFCFSAVKQEHRMKNRAKGKMFGEDKPGVCDLKRLITTQQPEWEGWLTPVQPGRRQTGTFSTPKEQGTPDLSGD